MKKPLKKNRYPDITDFDDYLKDTLRFESEVTPASVGELIVRAVDVSRTYQEGIEALIRLRGGIKRKNFAPEVDQVIHGAIAEMEGLRDAAEEG